jgi:hypothetical protein
VARDVQIAGGVGAAPQSYTVPNATEILPRAVFATFNGAGAAGAFLPTVQIVSDGGVVVASVSTDAAVAAGGSASVTFAPFLRAAAAGGGSGIQFDTRPQAGGFLQVTTTDAGANSFNLESGGQMDIRADETLTVLSHADLEVSSTAAMTIDSQAGITITNTAAGVLLIESSPDGGITIRDQGGAASAGITVESSASGISVSGEYIVSTVRSDNFYVVLGLGVMVQVLNHLSAPIFEVREDGTIHGLASVGAITWDL